MWRIYTTYLKHSKRCLGGVQTAREAGEIIRADKIGGEGGSQTIVTGYWFIGVFINVNHYRPTIRPT